MSCIHRNKTKNFNIDVRARSSSKNNEEELEKIKFLSRTYNPGYSIPQI
jgi:hypothetical protein